MIGEVCQQLLACTLSNSGIDKSRTWKLPGARFTDPPEVKLLPQASRTEPSCSGRKALTYGMHNSWPG